MTYEHKQHALHYQSHMYAYFSILHDTTQKAKSYKEKGQKSQIQLIK